jgi:hypothetical protein
MKVHSMGDAMDATLQDAMLVPCEFALARPGRSDPHDDSVAGSQLSPAFIEAFTKSFKRDRSIRQAR